MRAAWRCRPRARSRAARRARPPRLSVSPRPARACTSSSSASTRSSRRSVRDLAQQPLEQLDRPHGVAAIQHQPCAAQERLRRPARAVEQLDRVVRPALAPAQLRQPGERAADPGRARAGEVLDRRVEHRLGVAPAAAPDVDRAVLGAAEREHVAAAVALRERVDALAPLRRPLEVEHGGARGDQDAERPCARDRDRGAALQRGRRRLVEAAHAVTDAGLAHQRRALQREAEHLEVGHAAAPPEVRRHRGERARRGGVAGAVREVALVEREPAVVRPRLEIVEQPVRALQPAVGDGLGALELDPVDREPRRHAGGAAGVAAVAVDPERALAGREHGRAVVHPPGGPAQPLQRLGRLRGVRERRAGLRPAPVTEKRPAVAHRIRAHGGSVPRARRSRLPMRCSRGCPT